MKRDWHGRFIKGHLGFNKGKRLVKYKKIICPVCKVEFEIREKSNRKFCNKKICIYKGRIRKEHSYSWKGGKTIHRGYIYIYRPNHPFANKNGYIFEHRLKMEEFMGRHLTKDEIIHHLDGDRQNNFIGNLILLKREEHIKIHGPKQCQQ